MRFLLSKPLCGDIHMLSPILFKILFRKNIIITLLLISFLLAVVNVYIYSLFSYQSYDRRCYDEYASWVSFRFRDELQYRGDRFISSADMNNVDPGLNFNSDGSMDKYRDYLPCMERVFFDAFSGYEHVVEYCLTYSEIVYRDAYTDVADGCCRCGFALVGGEPENYIRNSFNGLKTQGSCLRINIKSGRYYGRGECIISNVYAESNDIETGDVLTFDDDGGNEVITLTVAGIYEAYDDYQNKKAPLNEGSFQSGSTPFYRYTWNSPEHALTQHIIYCSFEDSYYAFGDENTDGFAERHNFNKYIAWYKLSDIAYLDGFKEYSRQMNADENLGFYADDQLYSLYVGKYEAWEKDAWKIVVFVMMITFLTVTAVSAVSAKDRAGELDILRRLGLRERNIILALFLFHFFTVLSSSVIAMLLTAPVKRLCELMQITFWNPPVVFTFRPDHILCIIILSLIVSAAGGVSASVCRAVMIERQKHGPV